MITATVVFTPIHLQCCNAVRLYTSKYIKLNTGKKSRGGASFCGFPFKNFSQNSNTVKRACCGCWGEMKRVSLIAISLLIRRCRIVSLEAVVAVGRRDNAIAYRFNGVVHHRRRRRWAWHLGTALLFPRSDDTEISTRPPRTEVKERSWADGAVASRIQTVTQRTTEVWLNFADIWPWHLTLKAVFLFSD